jgi:putative transposase
MDAGMVLHGSQREKLLEWYRRSDNPQVRLRAHILLLLADGYPWAMITAVLYCSSRTIALWKKRFADGGIEALLGEERGRPPILSWHLAATAAGWVRHYFPGDFGFLRSRWCCRTIVVLLLELHQVQVSQESVRRWLHEAGLVWRRPRPVLGPQDPDREAKLAAIRLFLRYLPADQIALFQDEVDINTNPKIGSMWMDRGIQAQVPTPGTNVKRYLSGSLDWRSGNLIATPGEEGQGRNTDLFLAHLDDLRRHYRCYKVIHDICDNAKPHTSARTKAYVAQSGGRIVLHYLPRYAPEANPTERVWWKLHEAITRNHRCPHNEALLDQVMAWLGENLPFGVEDQVYFPVRKAA